MKKLLVLFIIPFAAFAAAPVVTIDNASNVYVDGVNVGQPADAIANNEALAPAIQVALVAFVNKTKTDADTAIAAKESEKQSTIAAKETEKQNAISAAQTAVTDTLAAKDEQIATLTNERAAANTSKATTEQQLAAMITERDAKAAHITQLQAQVQQLEQDKAALQEQLAAAQQPSPGS